MNKTEEPSFDGQAVQTPQNKIAGLVTLVAVIAFGFGFGLGILYSTKADDPDSQINTSTQSEYIDIELVTFSNPALEFFVKEDQRLVAITKDGKREVLVNSIREAIPQSVADRASVNELGVLLRRLGYSSSQQKAFFVAMRADGGSGLGQTELYLFDLQSKEFESLPNAYRHSFVYPGYSLLSPDESKFISISTAQSTFHNYDDQKLVIVNLLDDSIDVVKMLTGIETFVPHAVSHGGFPVLEFLWLDNQSIQITIFDNTRQVDGEVGKEHPSLRTEIISWP